MKKLIIALALCAACGGSEPKGVTSQMIRYGDACERLSVMLAQEWQAEVSWAVCEISGERHCVVVTVEPFHVEPCEWALAILGPR